MIKLLGRQKQVVRLPHLHLSPVAKENLMDNIQNQVYNPNKEFENKKIISLELLFEM